MAVSLAEVYEKTQIESVAKPAQIAGMQTLSAEQEIILECSRAKLKDVNKKRVGELLKQTLNLEKLVGTAHRNGVLPLVCAHLLQSFSDVLPADVRRKIAGTFQRHTQRNLFLTLKLIEITRFLKDAGIPSMPIKGPTLAVFLYGNAVYREFIDLDILVQPKNFDRAVDLLMKKGYRMTVPMNWLIKNATVISGKKDVGLRHPDENVLIELHWKLSGGHFSLPFEIEALWNRLETVKIGETQLNSLGFYDLFVYLCLHGSRHGWERLGWICDLHELILAEERRGRTIDWTSIYCSAKKHGCEKVVELGLYIVWEFFDLETDYPQWKVIKSERTFKKIASQVRSKILADERITTEIGDWYLYHLALKERKTDRVKLHLHYLIWYFQLAFTPGSLDKEIFHLPAAFYPLYFILRPVRLLYNRIRKPPPNRD